MKFKIKDENGDMYTVEKDKEEVKEVDMHDADDFTADEKKLLKKLLDHAEELLNLLEVEKEEHDADFTDEELELEENEAVTEVTGGETDVVEDSEKLDDRKVHDSKAAFGSIERTVPTIDKELEMQNEIVAAWTKRYGG